MGDTHTERGYQLLVEKGPAELAEMVSALELQVEQLQAENERLKGGIEKWLREGVNKYDSCPHGKMRYEGCEACDESYFAALIAPQESRDK